MTSQKPPSTIGRYDVIRLLGEGAMGRVLLAHDPVLEREVALKHLRANLSIPSEQRDSLVQRIRQEARASARISHPNIVALHDMGEDDSVGLFLVFEYVPGLTLKSKLSQGNMGALRCATLAKELGRALTTAHAAGVIHRDIKPDNIMLSKGGSKIADFGIARLPNSTLTQAGLLLGTPAYSAPESIQDGLVSPLSDQFSLAATLYEALVGHRAFPGEDAVAVATKIAQEEPPALAEVCGVDLHVDTVLARALSKNPTARFDSCEDFGDALAEAIELAPRSTMPTLPDQEHRASIEPPATKSGRIAAGAAALGAIAAVVAFQLTEGLKAPPPETATLQVSRSVQPTVAVETAPIAWLEKRPQKKSQRRLPAALAGPADAGTRTASAGDASSSRTAPAASGDSGVPK